MSHGLLVLMVNREFFGSLLKNEDHQFTLKIFYETGTFGIRTDKG